MQLTLKSKVIDYLKKEKGWRMSVLDKIRGIRPDLVATTKDGKIVAVEIKGLNGSIDGAIRQALHFKNAVNFSYIALPEKRVTARVKSVCSGLGIGLVSIDNSVHEVVIPDETDALDSIKHRLLNRTKPAQLPLKQTGSLEKLFKSKSLVLVLKLLFLNSDKQFHLNEISRRVGISASTASKELGNMASLGLVRKRLHGNMTLYQINSDSIIFADIRKIFFKFELLDGLLLDELNDFDLKFVLIFGSFANMAETANSDVDLLIVGSIPEDKLIDIVNGLEDKIEREINYIFWTSKEFDDRSKNKTALLQNIATEQVIMVIGDEEEFRRSIK